MELYLVLGFAGVAFALIVVPGPDWAYVLSVGLRERVVLPAVGGLMIGYLLLTIAVAAGVGPLVSAAPWTLTALTFAGAAYLLYLGIRTIRAATTVTVAASHAPAARSLLALVAQGAGVSALNPKALLLFLAILPQFVRTTGWPVSLQIAVLGATYIALCSSVYIALSFAAARVLHGRPSVSRAITRVSGAAMIVVAALLIAERAYELVA